MRVCRQPRTGGDQGKRPRAAAEEMKKLDKVATPGKRSVEEVTAFLNIPAQRLVKTIIFETDKGPVAALVRGDHEINEAKLAGTSRRQGLPWPGTRSLPRSRARLSDLPGPSDLN